MPTSCRILAPLALLLLVTGCDRGEHPRNLDRQAPGFTLSDGTETIALQQLRGKVVLLNLWASWCAPCLQELPSLLALHQQMPDLAIVGISIDQDEAAYRRFLADRHVTFPSVRDPEQRINRLYGTSQIPETYVIDRNGTLVRKFVDAQNWTSPEITAFLQHLE